MNGSGEDELVKRSSRFDSSDGRISPKTQSEKRAERASAKGGGRRPTGEGGEFLAECYLVERGYEILCRNYVTRRGEIDLIVRKDGVVAFVEVRFRHGFGFGSPVESVTRAKRRKISLAALEYDAANGFSSRGMALRFDILAITDRGGRITFAHLENAFESSVRPFSAAG